MISNATYRNLGKVKSEILFFIFLICSTLVFSQPTNVTEEDVIKQANELFSNDDYQGALPLYAQLVSVHPAEAEYNYRFGVCTLFGDRHDKKKPIRYLTNASKSMKDDQMLVYYLGLAYHQNEEYATAMRHFNMYLAKLSPNSSERANILEKINACLNGLNLSHKRLIAEIVSKSEFQKDNFHRAYRADQFDGSLVLKPEIFQTSKEKKRGELSFVYLSEPRDVLYYAGYENDKSTNKDIYKVVMGVDGNWGLPEKLDASINTPYDEDYPIMMDNGTSMYFCSKGHSSLGGFDIYRTKLDTANNTFSQPENLGAGINSPFDDIMFVMDKEGKQAYFASERDNLNGTINVYNIKLVDNPFNEEMLLAQENNLEEIFAQQQAASNQTSQLAQGNSKVAAYKAAHEQKVTAVQQTTSQSPSAASQKADNMMADRTRAHQMADSAYLVIASTKKLIRDLTNKRDRANAISKRKADEAKTLETRFDESISMIVKIENENQFKTSLSKAIELKVEVCQLNKRAEIADQIAWNLGRQIKTKNKELEKLKLQAGKIQTASVSGSLEESNIIFTDFRNLVVKADTIVDFTSQIMAITNNEATYEVPKTQLAFAENLMTAFHNNTLMAAALDVKVVVQENTPIEIVDKRTYKPELASSETSTPIKAVTIKPVELISQISTDGILMAGNEPIENELELNFNIDTPDIQILDLVAPVSFTQFAFATEPEETELELNFFVDQIKPLDLVTQVDMTYVAFNDITIDEDHLDLSFDIDKKPIQILPLINQVIVESYAFNPELEQELEINFEIDKRVVNAIGIIQPVFVTDFAYNTEPEENDIELNFELDMVEPIELIYPVDLSLIAFNDITIDEKELEINYAADKAPIEVAPLIAPIYKENLALIDIELEGELEINFDVDQPEINILKIAEPVYMTGYVFSTEPVELMLDISTSNDKINPVELINPVNINAIAFSDITIDEDLDLDFTIDKPAINVASVVNPIFYASTSNDIEFFENELELNFTNDKVEIHAIDIINPVYSTAFVMDVYPDESEIEVNFNTDRIVPATLVNPVNITAIAYNDIITEEFLELSFEVDEPTINIVPQIHTIEMLQFAINTEPEEFDLDINFTIDKFKPILLANQIEYNLVAFNDSYIDNEILELNFDIDKLEVNVIPQVDQIYVGTYYAMNTELEETELDINLAIDKPAFKIPQNIQSIAYAEVSDMILNEEALEINFNIDVIELIIPDLIQTIAYTDIAGITAFDEELEINFNIDNTIAIPQIVETVDYASNTNLEGEEIEDVIQIDFDVDKQLNAFMEANRASRQEALFYLRESVSQATNIETSRSDLEILELALTNPDELSYEELLYAASLAFRPEDKLVIYNAAFIHIDRDWRAYNNAAVSAIHVASLGQADCYLFQAALISEDNGSIANNRGILACYKDQFDIAEKHFVAASHLGYDALYNLQVVNNLVIDFEVERIAGRNQINQNKDTQKAVVDVIDYGTSSSDD